MDIYLAFVFTVLGLIIGSAINSLVWRLAKEVPLSGRSICPSCRRAIHWHDNVPILSYIMLAGRCRFCRAFIPWHYPVVEAAGGLLFLAIFWQQYAIYGPFLYPGAAFWLGSVLAAVIAGTLLFSFVFDASYFLVSNAVIIPGALLAGALRLLLGASWLEMLGVLAISLLFFGGQYLLTRRQGIGEGDIWLGAALALMFPDLAQWLLLIAISYFIGAAVGLSLMFFGLKNRKDKLPLGVFLALGGVISLFFGPQIVDWYLSLLIL